MPLIFLFLYIVGDGLDTFSFSAGLSKGSFAPAPTSQLNASLGQSWSFYNFVGGGQMGATFPTTVRNPNKAILTIEARTTKVGISSSLFHNLKSILALTTIALIK